MRIEHRICRNNLGETTAHEAEAYARALRAALIDEYPDADIEVNLRSEFANTSQTLIAADDEDEGAVRERVDDIANRVWERC